MEPWQSWLTFGIAFVATAIVVVVVLVIVSYALTMFTRRTPSIAVVRNRSKSAFRTLVAVGALWAVVTASFPLRDWVPALTQLFSIVMIALVAWFLVTLVYVLADLSNRKYEGSEGTVAARRLRTQMTMVRRLLIVIVVVIALGSILMTFPGIRTIGASVLASAGIASIVAGLAAQSVLGNLIAGVQLAFSDAARVGDVVVVEGEWGRIGEITLAYVVVDVWDERRLIVPCTYFTSQPFTNWTRRSSLILGTVEFDIDWRVSISAMRTKMNEVLAGTDLWDGRSASLQITDATGGMVRVRASLSAEDSGKIWDLRCLIREEMIAWLQKNGSFSLPVTRVQMVDAESADRRMSRAATKGAQAEADRDQSGMFTGSPEAEARGSLFTGAIPIQERQQLDQELDDTELHESAAVPMTDEQADPKP